MRLYSYVLPVLGVSCGGINAVPLEQSQNNARTADLSLGDATNARLALLPYVPDLRPRSADALPVSEIQVLETRGTYCHLVSGPFPPFCAPNNGSVVQAGGALQVTWDPSFFPINGSIAIKVSYLNASALMGASAFYSEVENKDGTITLTTDAAWLQGQSSHDLTLFITPLGPDTGENSGTMQGPTVSLIENPAQTETPSTQPSHLEKRRLILGLSIGLGSLVLLLGLLFYYLRFYKRATGGTLIDKSFHRFGFWKSRQGRGDGHEQERGTAEMTNQGSSINSQANSTNERIEKADEIGVELKSLSDNAESVQKPPAARENVFRQEISRLRDWKKKPW